MPTLRLCVTWMPKAWCGDADDTDFDEVDKDEYGWVENLKYVDHPTHEFEMSTASWASWQVHSVEFQEGWPADHWLRVIYRHFMIFLFAFYIILGISNFASIFAQTCPPFLALRQLWRAPRSTRNTCKQTSHDMLSLSVNTMDEVYTYRIDDQGFQIPRCLSPKRREVSTHLRGKRYCAGSNSRFGQPLQWGGRAFQRYRYMRTYFSRIHVQSYSIMFNLQLGITWPTWPCDWGLMIADCGRLRRFMVIPSPSESF